MRHIKCNQTTVKKPRITMNLNENWLKNALSTNINGGRFALNASNNCFHTTAVSNIHTCSLSRVTNTLFKNILYYLNTVHQMEGLK